MLGTLKSASSPVHVPYFLIDFCCSWLNDHTQCKSCSYCDVWRAFPTRASSRLPKLRFTSTIPLHTTRISAPPVHQMHQKFKAMFEDRLGRRSRATRCLGIVAVFHIPPSTKTVEKRGERPLFTVPHGEGALIIHARNATRTLFQTITDTFQNDNRCSGV